MVQQELMHHFDSKPRANSSLVTATDHITSKSAQLLLQRLLDCFGAWTKLGLSAGLHKNYRMSFHDAQMEDGSWPRLDPVNFWCGSRNLFSHFNIVKYGAFFDIFRGSWWKKMAKIWNSKLSLNTPLLLLTQLKGNTVVQQELMHHFDNKPRANSSLLTATDRITHSKTALLLEHVSKWLCLRRSQMRTSSLSYFRT